MSLANALRQALDPATREEGLRNIRLITFFEGSPNKQQAAACAMLLLHGVDPREDRVESERRALVSALISVGAPYIDTRTLDAPYSAEWVNAALHLADWADAQVTL